MNSRTRRKQEALAYNAYREEEKRLAAQANHHRRLGNKLKAMAWFNKLREHRRTNPQHSIYGLQEWLKKAMVPTEEIKEPEEGIIEVPVGNFDSTTPNANGRVYSKTALTAMAVMATAALSETDHPKGR